MKTRTLFLTLLICISILVITSGLAFADPITGCVKKSSGKLYNVQIGTEPAFPGCSLLDEKITWSEEGPQGPPGENGEDGQDGAPGGPQFILKDNNGNEVGEVISVNVGAPSFVPANAVAVPPFWFPFSEERSVLTLLQVEKADTSIVTVGVPAIRTGFQFQNRIMFDNTECTGNPRISMRAFPNAGFPPAFTLSAVVGTPGQPLDRKLYVQANETVPTNPLIQSVLVGDFCISPVSFAPPSVSMELINPLLNVTHPGPFTLERP
jgi:hypothetical protein